MRRTTHLIEVELRDGPPRRVRYTASARRWRLVRWSVTSLVTVVACVLTGIPVIRRSSLWDGLLFPLVGGAACLLLLLLFVSELILFQQKQTLEKGVAVAANVVDRSVKVSQQSRDRTYVLRIEFVTGRPRRDNRRRTGLTVTKAVYERHPPGSTLTYLYLPESRAEGNAYVALTSVEIVGCGRRAG